MRLRLLAALLAMPLLTLPLLCAGASAESLVATLSDDAVEITSNFTGEQIVVFGAVRGAQEDEPPYEVAVVVQGPTQDVVVRQKGRVLGVWLNRASREMKEVPSYYVMHLSENFAKAVTPADLVQYRLGLASLPFVQSAVGDASAERFAQALVDLRVRHALYAERQDDVKFLAPGVFRTTFFLPSDIPTGDYKVNVYLFRGETFLAGQTQKLSVAKGGFSQEITNAALDYPFLYGTASVLLALFTGWLAGVVFRRG